MLSAFYLYSICGFFRDALLEQFSKISDVLFGDKQFNLNGKEYLDAVYNNPPYVRIESVLLKAFTGMQKMEVPALIGARSERIYELRSYEGHTEKDLQE